MRDISGSRFLQMAGGQGFFSQLNKGLQSPMQKNDGQSSLMGPNDGEQVSSPRYPKFRAKVDKALRRRSGGGGGGRGGDLRIAAPTATGPNPNIEYPDDFVDTPKFTPEPTRDDFGHLDQPQTKYSPKPGRGPGSFGTQAEREKFLKDNNIAQGDSYTRFTSGIKAINDALGIGSGAQLDVDQMIQSTIQRGLEADNTDLVKLDQAIRKAPLIDEARAKLHGLNAYGDVARWRTEMLPAFTLPIPMEAVKDPDIKGFYDKISGDIKDTGDDWADRLD